jgi:RNA polymerase sigma factor (sigma-70 family)
MKIDPEKHRELAKIISGDLNLINAYYFCIIGKFHSLKANCNIECLADDICQGSFLAIQENNDKGYLVGIKNEKGYIYRITKNKIIDEHNRICRFTRILVKDEYSDDYEFGHSLNLVDEINPEIYCASNYMKRALWNAIRKLIPKHQLIVLLRYWKQMSYKQIANIVGSTSGCIGVTLTNIKIKLKSELTKNLI